MRALAAALLVLAAPAAAEIAAARYAEPTDRYPHAVLGDPFEWGALVFEMADGHEVVLRLPETRVFEDVAPRLHDLDGDGDAEAVVVESDRERGARLAVMDETGLVAATPFVGQAFRWLAPAGAADLDGDGAVEIAFVDRPHLARILRVWRFADGTLTEVAALEGHTNHAIGEPDIAGGIRDCGEGPEIITATPDWTRLQATRLANGLLVTYDLGPHENRAAFAEAMACNR